MHIIDLQGIEKTYDLGGQTVRALAGVSLQVEAGEFIAIMGPSGSGKSSLMNVLGCLDTPTRGKYLLEGHEVGQLSRAARAKVRNHRLGFVFQNFSLLSRTTALENVELPLLYAGMPAKERRERAVESLRRVNLGDRLDHHPNQLSGGQQQRVAIARALVGTPAVLLADEPTGNLDSKTSIEVMSLFQGLGRTGITVVLVTHEPDVAQYAARVVVVRDGLIVSDQKQTPTQAIVPPGVVS